MIENHQTIIADRITKGKKQWRFRATRNLKIKMAVVSPSLSIIILKVHRLNSPQSKGTELLDGLINKAAGDSPQLQRTEAQSDGVEDDTSSKWIHSRKERKGSNKMRNERGEIKEDITEILRII